MASLDRISIKYEEEVKLIQCVRMFFQNPNDFSLKCSQMSKPYLKTYISILIGNYDSRNKHSEDVLFDVEYILKSMLTKTQIISENDVLNELLDILALTIVMSKETENNLSSKEVLDEYLKKLIYTDNEQIVAVQLSAAEVVYKIYPELFIHSIQTSIVKFIFNETQIIQNKSLKLVRQMIEDDNQSALLTEILNEIEKNKTAKRIQCLAALCYLIDCVAFSKAYTNRSSFRSYLQQELLSTDRYVCKYALYIMRKFIEFQSNGIEETLLSGSNMTAPWETFFLIQETLEEKQSHLILPVLELLPKTQNLPMNWYYVLMTQLLRHENTVVLQCGLTYAITNIRCDAESVSNDDLITAFFTSLMNGLNNTFLYGKTDFPVAELKHFFEPIVEIVFEKLLTINWKSVPMYYIVDSIADLIFNQNRHNNEDLAEKYIKILRLVNKLPNVHIRKGIQFNIKRSIGGISGHLSVDAFSQLIQLASITTMKELEFLKFESWTHDDVITVLGHKNLSDEVKTTFLTRVEITDDDLLCLLKLMKMNDFTNFHIFEALAPLHFYTLNIWLSKSLQSSDVPVKTTLSMYYLLYVINDRQHNNEIVKVILQQNELFLTWTKVLRTPEVRNQQHLIECIYKIYSIYHDANCLLTEFIACGTEQSILVALDIMEEHQDQLDEDRLTEIVACVKELQNATVIKRLMDIMKLKKVCPFRNMLYPQLIQMTFNNNHLLAIVVDQFLEEDDTFLVSCSKHIQNLLCYGIPLKGDQRIEYDLCQMIYCNDIEWVMSSHIRFKLLFKLLNGFSSKNKSNTTFINDITNYLFKLSADLNLSKSRYYADSQQHRSKLRIVQALAVLLHRSGAWDIRLQTALLNENNQPNVTFILELMIGRTIDSSHLSKMLQEAKSNSARQSLFIIMYYVSSRLNRNDWASRYIDNILPFTMGQHFNTRLFAQIAIVKIIEKFKMNVSTNKYNSVYEQIMHSFRQGNAKQISDKFLQDFRFTCIDCTDLLNPIYFLCEIPRVTHMAKDELIPWKLVRRDGSNEKFLFKGPFHVNINMCGAHNENVDVDNLCENVQKKIIPMKNIVPDATLLETLPNYSQQSIKKPKKDGMIVVASLVSRSPNLGGLSRTCEIFGIEQLILDSLKQIENKEFQSLSMTSEKWLNIGEIKSWQLFDYLVSMKSNGYFIIGAEQTANGKKLTDLKFPRKTVLLLGHEKDGIPANLLSVLDVAVEIPQFGVVRSLNVHVSGALFVWEYAKQHNF